MNYDFSINIAICPPKYEFLATPLPCSATLTTTTIELHKLYVIKLYAFTYFLLLLSIYKIFFLLDCVIYAF